MKNPVRWLFTTLVIAVVTPAFAANDHCLSVSAVKHGGFLQSTVATYTMSGPVIDLNNNSTFTYTFSGWDPNNPYPSLEEGVPGLISYCVYPAQPPGNPDAITVDPGAVGANSQPFDSEADPAGSFSWSRADGNPSNIPFDGNTYTMGTATWFALNGLPVYPSSQTVLLHINDSVECNNLYPEGGSDTCWVFATPGGPPPPPPPTCNDAPACKSAIVSDGNGHVYGNLDQYGYVIVPLFTKLYIDYSYEIINQPDNPAGLTMTFKYPWAKTDINNGGGKDYFGCEQVPNPGGFPGTWGSYPVTDAELNSWIIAFTQGGGNCNQSRFTLLPDGSTIVFALGDYITFDVNMNTRLNVGKSGKYEYTKPGPHLLNSGFTIKWFQNIPDGNGNCVGGQQAWSSPRSLCSFSTNVTPIYVDAQGSGY